MNRSFSAGKTKGNGFRPDAGPGLPGDILKKEEEEQKVTQKYSPVAEPETSLKNTENKIKNKKSTSSGKKSGGTTSGGKTGGSTGKPDVFSPILGVPDPLERLRNRVNVGSSFLTAGPGLANRGENNPWVPPVQREMEKQGLVGRNVFYDTLQTAQGNAKVKRYLQEAERAKAEKLRKAEERNSILGKYGILTSSDLEKQIRINRDKMSALLHTVNGQWSKRVNQDAKNSDTYRQLAADNQTLLSFLSDLKLEEYDALRENKDFAEKSRPQEQGLFGDWNYAYINQLNGVRAKQDAASRADKSVNKLEKYGYLNSKERGIYNYLYAVEGKKKANEYLSWIEADLNERQAAVKDEDYLRAAKAHPFLATVATVAASPSRPVEDFLGKVSGVWTQGTGKRTSEYSDRNQAMRATEVMRGQVRNELEDQFGPAAAKGYDAATLAADAWINAKLLGSAAKITFDDVMKVGGSNVKKTFSFDDVLNVKKGKYGVENAGNHGIIKSNEFQYLPTSGAKLTATSGKTTTVLGSYQSDMRYIVQELGNVKSTDFGPKDGGFNILNVPDDMYKTPEQFWNEVNKPWLIEAIARGDDIVLATKPTKKAMWKIEPKSKTKTLTGFGREYQFLIENGYSFDRSTGMMVRK